MTNGKVFLTLECQDQNCHFSFLTVTGLTFILSLSKLHAKRNAPKIFTKQEA